jgi:hypothetical protein
MIQHVDESPDRTMLGGSVDAMAHAANVVEAAESVTQVMMRPRTSFPPPPMPDFEIDRPVRRRHSALGAAAFAMMVSLPLLYVYERGQVVTELPAATPTAPEPTKVEDVTSRIEHGRITPLPPSPDGELFAVPASHPARKR